MLRSGMDVLRQTCGSRPAAAFGRGRARSEPVRIHLRAGAGPGRGRHHGAVPRGEKAGRRGGTVIWSSFMCRPALPNVVLQRLAPASVAGRKQDEGRTRSLSITSRTFCRPLGRYFLAGLTRQCARRARLRHADDQRLQALSRPLTRMAPDRAVWARDNRGVMMRVTGPAGRCCDASGEPRRRAAANPVSLHGVADLFRARRHRTQARSWSVGGHAL